MVTWDSSFSETYWERERKPKTDGRTEIQTEEWEKRRVNDERRASRRLRTTMSALHVVFPSISSCVCLSVSLSPSGFIQISLLVSHVFSFPVVISHPSLSSFLYVSFSSLSVIHLSSLLSISAAVSLQLCTCSFDCSFLCLEFLFNSVHIY